MTKLYKSGRYYYRTKLNVETKPATRRKYVPLSNEFISLINRHIEMQQDNLELKPSTGFDDFCKIHIDNIMCEIGNLKLYGLTDKTEIIIKLKKAYKNQFFQLRVKK